MKVKRVKKSVADLSRWVNFEKLRDFERWYTVQELSEITGVHRTTIWRWRKMGLISAFRCGGSLRFRESDVKRLMHQH